MGEAFDFFGLVSTISPGNWITIVVVLGATAIWWIRTMPDLKRADNERQQIKVNESELIRTDYAAQIHEFRLEVQRYKDEVAALRLELIQTQNTSLRRGDRLNMVFFILRLVMGELRRLDPNSEILAQAEALLSRVEHENDDPDKSKALNAAEHTEAAAAVAVEEVKHAESAEVSRKRRRT